MTPRTSFWLRSLLGAVLGAVLGQVIFSCLWREFSLLSPALPGAFLGWGAGMLGGGRSTLRGAICAALALFAGALPYWYVYQYLLGYYSFNRFGNGLPLNYSRLNEYDIFGGGGRGDWPALLLGCAVAGWLGWQTRMPRER